MPAAETTATAVGLGGLALLVAAFFGSYLWRALGVAVAGRLDVDSPVVGWVSCVVVAMIVGLSSRLVLSGPGALAHSTLAERVAGIAVGLAVFVLFRRNVVAGTLAGVAAVALAASLARLAGG